MTDAIVAPGSAQRTPPLQDETRIPPWYTRRTAGESLKPEALLIASDVELDLALEAGLPIPQRILAAFSSLKRLEQLEGAIELRRWKAMRETQPQLGMTYEIIRDALTRAAGGAASATSHTTGNPPETDEDYRAAVGSMLDELRRIYTLVLERDRLFGRIRSVALVLLLCLLGVLVSTRGMDGLLGPGTANLIEIAAAGGLGAIVSILRRMQDANASRPLGTDPVQQISALREGYPSLAIAAITGPIFALTLFVVFASGLVVISGVTPSIPECGVVPDKPCLGGYFTVMNRMVHFASSIDALKMLLWGFVAGFAEKLVPDVLDKITGSLPMSSKAR